jgi:two-component system, cell cycle response regulator DivK
MSTCRKIAIVEDHDDNRSMLHIFLENQRYSVTSYSTGSEALPGMRENTPNVLLCDISLPDIDGPAILRKMRQDDALRHIPVIAVTAHAMTGDRETFLGMGFDDYLSKPVNFDQLIDAIEMQLAK